MNFPPKPTKPPAYTPEQRKQIAANFRAAKSILWDGCSYDGCLASERFICRAVQENQLVGTGLACDVVADRLVPSVTVEHWISNRAELTFATHAERARYRQEFRHGWLDSLIAEFEGTEE